MVGPFTEWSIFVLFENAHDRNHTPHLWVQDIGCIGHWRGKIKFPIIPGSLCGHLLISERNHTFGAAFISEDNAIPL